MQRLSELFGEKITSDIDGLVQERRNSIAKALELRLSCTNPSIYGYEQMPLTWHNIHDWCDHAGRHLLLDSAVCATEHPA